MKKEHSYGPPIACPSIIFGKKNQCLMLLFTCCTSNDTERNVEKGCLFGSDDENRDHSSFHVQLEAPPNYEAYPGSIFTPFFLVSVLSIYTYTW